jgi:hypothetical protein
MILRVPAMNRPDTEARINTGYAAQAENGYRTAIPVVGRVVDELIVDGKVGEAEYGDAIIYFQDLLGTVAFHSSRLPLSSDPLTMLPRRGSAR